MNSKAINSNTSETNNYTIISKGDTYGRYNSITHNNDKKLIEFRKNDFMISRYYLETFLEVENGLCLDGGSRQYDLSTEDVKKIQSELK